MTRARKAAVAFALAVGAVALASSYLMKTNLVDQSEKAPAALLEPGWQFYTKPTTLDPPGTVFRIDNQRRRFAVDEIATPITTGAEVFGAKAEAIRTSARMLFRFIGGHVNGVVGQGGDRLETLEFEMFDVQKEVTTDMAILGLLREFRSRVEYRRDNRYFIIRESRSALALRYSLSEELMNGLGGTVAISELVKADSGLSYESRGTYVLNQKLPARMRVMFLAEEITPTSSMTGGKPEFETVPVTSPLIWE